jgi:uncharacterized protein
MQKVHKKEFIIDGSLERPITMDVTLPLEYSDISPVIIFSHGFKGFKDWGHFNLLANKFAEQNFIFIKFNFSYNGTTPENLTDFADLEAFGNNNFSRELDDLNLVINWAEKTYNSNLTLIGHSRGGGISLLKTKEDPRIKKVVSWASPASFENRYTPQQVEYWKKAGVIYVENSRTKQQMPLYYQMVEDFYANKNRLDIQAALMSLKQPCLIIHGKKDDVINYSEAHLMKEWCSDANLILLEEADHTFGISHPYSQTLFSNDFETVFAATTDFLKGNTKIKS